MRILTVRQPWAWAIIHGGKDVENRTRNLAGSYRGPVAIHAALADDLEAWQGLCRTSLTAWSQAMDSRESLLSGVILGVVDLVGVHISKMATTRPGPVCFKDGQDPCSIWGQRFDNPGGYHLELANPRAIAQPHPYKGALGLRELPDDVAAQILAGVAS